MTTGWMLLEWFMVVLVHVTALGIGVVTGVCYDQHQANKRAALEAARLDARRLAAAPPSRSEPCALDRPR